MILRNKDKEKLIEIFSHYDLEFEVWAFGSRVSGDAHEGSDLDLVIRSNDQQMFPELVFKHIKKQIQHSNIPIIVELFDWAQLPETFHKNILSNHEVLYHSELITLHEPESEYKKSDKN